MMKKLQIIALSMSLFFIVASNFALSQNANIVTSNSSSATIKTNTAPTTPENNEDEDKSWFLSFIEDKLSSPSRQIRLSKIQGVLSSKAEIGLITVSDSQGVWLKITDAKMDWNRLALLRGTISINELSASKIEVFRKPLPESSVPSLESSGFTLPQLPVAVDVTLLNAGDVFLGEQLFDLAANVSIKGSFSLSDGDLKTNLNITRKDKVGQFDILANILTKQQQAEIAITASEPENGLIANMLQIENRPAIDLSIQGKGSLDDLVINIIMQAGKSPFLNGSVALKASEAGKNITANISGPISMLMPTQYHAFFGQDTALKLTALARKQGGFLLEDLQINGAAIHLKANAEILADGFLRSLNINGQIASQDGQSIILPIAGGTTSADKINLSVQYGGAGQTEWVGQFTAEHFKNPQFSANTISLNMGGATSNLDDAHLRQVGINITGKIADITSDNAKMANAIGKNITLNLKSTTSANTPYSIDDLTFLANGFAVKLHGTVENMLYQGAIDVSAEDLQVLSLLADKHMQGSIDIKANGSIALLSGGFDLQLDGNGKNLKTAIPQLDALLTTDTTLKGGIARGPQGLMARNFQLGNQQITLNANGQISKTEANMDIALDLADLALLDKRMQGPIQLQATARGHNKFIAMSVAASIKDGQFLDRKMQNGAFYINAMLDNSSPYQSYLSAKISGNGLYDNQKLQIAGNIHQSDDGFSLEDLQILQGDNQISGTISQNRQGLLAGNLQITAPDIAPLASLALQKGRGSLQARLRLFIENGLQQAEIISTIQNLKIAQNEVGNLDINATIGDPFKQFLQNNWKKDGLNLNGYAKAQNIKLPNLLINSLDAKVFDQNGQTAFQFAGEIENKPNNAIKAAFSGALQQGDGKNVSIGLHDFTLSDKNNKLSLLAPTTVTIAENDDSQYFVAIKNLQLKANNGSLNINGEVGNVLNLSAELNNFPLSVVNTIRPELQATGTITGKANIIGTLDNPNITFDILGQKLSLKALENYQIDPLNIKAKGNMNGDVLKLQADISGNQINANLDGSLALAKGEMDMQLEMQNFPVSLANSFIKNQNFNGALSGNAHVFGKMSNPSASFNLNGENLSAKTLSDYGLDTLSLNAKGNYGNSSLDLSSLVINGPQQLNINASGHIPLQGSGLDVQIKGSAPMALANHLLAERGAQISGDAVIDATVKGSLQAPQLGGHFNMSNGQFLDAETNLRLKDINIGLSLNGDQIIFDNVSASSNYGGVLTIGGALSTNFASGLPIDLTLTLNHARYNDGSMVAATVSGTLRINGALLQSPQITGDLTIEKAEITLADRLSSNNLIEVKHKNLNSDIATTLKRAGILTDKTQAAKTEFPFSPDVHVQIHAPNKIYVRGMGLDAELGGNMGVIGKLNDIHPVGGFQLIRGRFEMLSQRLDFTEGTVTLVGNLNPEINFIATSQGSDITVTVTVSGKADAPEITFSSSPTLPQDEVLARLIFKRSVGELSPLQIASLASAVAELSGITNESIFTTLRNATGLDDLDVITDDKGNTGLKAGRYIQDNVYLGVEAGSSGETKATINLDLSQSLKTKGSVDTNGDSSLGLFFEKDY